MKSVLGRIRRISYLLLVISCAVLSLPPAGGRAAEDEGRSLKRIETRLSEQQQKLGALELQEKDILSEVSRLQGEVSARESALKTLASDVRETEEEIARLRQELGRKEASLEQIRLRLGKELTLLYKFHREGYKKLLLTSEDVGELSHRVKYLRVFLHEDEKRLTALSGEVGEARAEIADLKQAIDLAGDSRAEALKRAGAMRSELEERVLELMKMHQEKKFYEDAVRELQLAANDIKVKLGSLERESRPPEGRFLDFEAARGRLPPPLKGRLLTMGGPSEKSAFSLRKGVFIDGGDAEAVRAVFPGRVDFSGSLKGYGDMIIVNHGNRYFTVMGQLTERSRKSGEWVERGDILGNVAPGRPLYFEIRKGTENLDPREWLRRG